MPPPSDDPSSDLPEPANLRFLRRLVTVLTAVMICGVLGIVALLVIRLSHPVGGPVLPAAVTLPEGAEADAVTVGRGWVGVVTADGRFLVYDAQTGDLRQTLTIDRP
jgi:hypothetical protein